MDTTDRVIIGLVFVALALLFFPALAKRAQPSASGQTTTTNALDSIVGESPRLGDAVGVASLTANSSWLFPPPLTLMMPNTGGSPVSPQASNGTMPTCNGC